MSNDIVPKGEPITSDEEWQSIVEKLVNELRPSELPDKVVRATEYLLSGWPRYKVARQLHVDTATIRNWITEYPSVAATLALRDKLLTKWRLGKLEQQFQLAMERSEEILNMELDGTYVNRDGEKSYANPKVLPVLAAQVRYMIGLAVGQKLDIRVTHEMGETVLKARQDALDYLADRLSEKDEPVEVTYRVIDERRDTVGPVLNEHGEPPFGKMGELDTNEEGTQCHVCGKRFNGTGLVKHISAAHDTTVEDYELLYMLPEGAVRSLGRDI